MRGRRSAVAGRTGRARLAVAGLLLAGLAVPPSGVAQPAAAGDPGQLVEAVAVRAAIPAVRARAWRISYVTRGPSGVPVLATGAVLVPVRGSAAPRALVGVALGSQGLADRCAPSRNLATGSLVEAPLLALLLARGAAVVVADGVGLGSSGHPTYAAARVDGPALLDAVRAARQSGLGGLAARAPVGLVGYSVGGGTVAMAAAVQPSYAPELPLAGAVAGGAVVDVAAYIRRGLRSGAIVAALSALDGLQAADAALTPPALTPRGRAALWAARSACILPAIAATAVLGGPRDGRFVSADPFGMPAWQAAAERQWPGGQVPGAPVLLLHGVRDEAVPFEGIQRLAAAWRGGGADVVLWALPLDHVGGLFLGMPGAVQWLEGRLAAAQG